jgi:hypothetical protein
MQSELTRTLLPEALPAGTEVGHWRVVEKLGVGGYGAAYQVEDIHHPGVMLALKLALRPGDARAGREVVLLMDKAVHPNVVRLHGHGRWPDPVEGHLYHVMDLVPGLPLDEWPETRNTSFLQLAEVGAKMALTLGALHARGVVHRDVSPVVDVGMMHRQVDFTGDEHPGPPGWRGLRVKGGNGGGRAVLLQTGEKEATTRGGALASSSWR